MSSIQRIGHRTLRSIPRINTAATRTFPIARRTKHYLSASSEQFEERLKNHDGRLVIVDFYADWCGPCKMISPVLEKTTSDTQHSNGKEVDLMTIDCDSEVELAQEYQVTSLPTVMAFRDGELLHKFIGAQPARAIQEWIRALSSE